MTNVESKNCPQCGAPTDAMTTICKFCGADIAPQYKSQPMQYQAPVYGQANQAPQYQAQPYAPVQQAPQYQAPAYAHNPQASSKSKTTAGVLALVLGGLGAHKFYLWKTGLWILYLIFCWTYIPAIIAFIEGIVILTASDEKFYSKYV